jgi:hypothetical protein
MAEQPNQPKVNYGEKVYGDVEIMDINKGIIMKDINDGLRYRVQLNAGVLTFTAI